MILVVNARVDNRGNHLSELHVTFADALLTRLSSNGSPLNEKMQ